MGIQAVDASAAAELDEVRTSLVRCLHAYWCGRGHVIVVRQVGPRDVVLRRRLLLQLLHVSRATAHVWTDGRAPLQHVIDSWTLRRMIGYDRFT